MVELTMVIVKNVGNSANRAPSQSWSCQLRWYVFPFLNYYLTIKEVLLNQVVWIEHETRIGIIANTSIFHAPVIPTV